MFDWHSRLFEDNYADLYLRIPTLKLAFIISVQSEGVWRAIHLKRQ
jgi:hypothetical protein